MPLDIEQLKNRINQLGAQRLQAHQLFHQLNGQILELEEIINTLSQQELEEKTENKEQ